MNIDFNSRKVVFYNHKTVDFSFNSKNESEYLLISFHGARYIDPKTHQPIALPLITHYSADPEDYDILCLCDKIIELKDTIITWFLSSKKYNYFPVYKEIIEAVISKKYKNIVFTGGSAGGFPAVVFSSIFKQSCIIFNAQIYLDIWRGGIPFKEARHYVSFISENDPIDLELFIKKHGPPKKLILYTNINDTPHHKNHMIPFASFMKTISSNFKLVEFVGREPKENETHHTVYCPGNKHKTKVILNLLKRIDLDQKNITTHMPKCLPKRIPVIKVQSARQVSPQKTTSLFNSSWMMSAKKGMSKMSISQEFSRKWATEEFKSSMSMKSQSHKQSKA